MALVACFFKMEGLSRRPRGKTKARALGLHRAAHCHFNDTVFACVGFSTLGRTFNWFFLCYSGFVSMAQLPEKLTDLGNYELWKEQMLNYLKAEGLIGVLEGFDANSSLSRLQKNFRKDRAYLAIKGRLGDEVARHVAGLKTATALMKKLDTLCKKQSLVQLKGIDAMVIEMRKLETQIMQQRGKIHTLNLKLEGMMKEHAQLKSQIDERKMDSYYF